MDKKAIADLVRLRIPPERPPDLGITAKELYDELQRGCVETSRRLLDADDDFFGVTMIYNNHQAMVYVHKDDMTEHYRLWSKEYNETLNENP